MIYVLIILCYAAVASFSIWTLVKTDFRQVGFADGCLIGAVFFILAPLAAILVVGQMDSFPIRAEPYRPFTDVLTTIHLLMGVLAVTAVVWMARYRRRLQPKTPSVASEFKKFDLFLLIVVYAIASVSTFFISGKNNGGHWMENLSVTFSTDTKAILISNFANVYRAAVFGVLFFLVEKKVITVKSAIIIGISVAIFDTLVTFNRITIAYFAIMSLLVMRRHFFAVSGAVALAVAPLSYVSNFWSTFRALALNDGLNANGLNKAFLITNSVHKNEASSIFNTLNSIFEASNIVVFNWIVKSVPNSFPVLWGGTFLVRPFTVLVPSTIWADKPAVFGTKLGPAIQGINGLVLNSTLFGEVYANFYYFWIPVLMLAIFLVDEIYARVSRWSLAYGFCAAFIAIACWRFDFAFTTIALVALLAFEMLRRALSRAQRSLMSSAVNSRGLNQRAPRF
jgi:hypothetical protein